MRILNVVGTRPNFVKMSALMQAYAGTPALEPLLVHTGQHFDERMSGVFFEQLGLPEPDAYLGVAGGTQAEQTGATMVAFETCLAELQPDAVLVVGDVNSTLACGLVAAKAGVRLIHVEAGLRSRDRSMPEEINRIVVDALADTLFCTEEEGVKNLLAEGHDPERVHFVGNVMVDSLLRFIDQARERAPWEALGALFGEYGVVTLHRPGNVDDPEVLERVLTAVAGVGARLPLLFPIHPRTRQRIADARLEGVLEKGGVRVVEPMGYLDFIGLLAGARLILSDSGGIQEEATILRVPCVVLRQNTERPVTLRSGATRLAAPENVDAAVSDALATERDSIIPPPLWDGHAGDRIARILAAETGQD